MMFSVFLVLVSLLSFQLVILRRSELILLYGKYGYLGASRGHSYAMDLNDVLGSVLADYDQVSDMNYWNVGLSMIAELDHEQFLLSEPKASITSTLVISFHIFAWRRVKSLKRLLNSLQNADYSGLKSRSFGIRLDLTFHIDGYYNPAVLDIIKEFKWNYGDIEILKSDSNKGLQLLMKDTQPRDSEGYSVFLEDDIELSVLYFDYILFCLSVSEDDQFAGCSFYTPRVDEVSEREDISKPSPINLSEMTEGSFVGIQIPCSWGAIYRNSIWSDFLNYYNARTDVEGNFPTIQGLLTHTWKRSWKKYLIEYFYLKGLYLIYPAFEDARSFSTNHYEDGVHTVSEEDYEKMLKDNSFPAEQLNVERGTIDHRFTVPLLVAEDKELAMDAFKQTTEIKTIFNVFHKVSSLEDLIQKGAEYQKEICANREAKDLTTCQIEEQKVKDTN